MTQFHSDAEAFAALTPADLGVLGSALDHCEPLCDDATWDYLVFILWGNDIASGALANDLAAYIVDDLNRNLDKA